ncbi:hypothetical protein VTK73DRAFT_3324 [Phialemonium thermophilum]|uniref:Uncharacterized protein n=1 Tax=Phialemonium thermophilum TaxID=223376 RepID=A0ABR3X0G9_9PEZI
MPSTALLKGAPHGVSHNMAAGHGFKSVSWNKHSFRGNKAPGAAEENLSEMEHRDRRQNMRSTSSANRSTHNTREAKQLGPKDKGPLTIEIGSSDIDFRQPFQNLAFQRASNSPPTAKLCSATNDPIGVTHIKVTNLNPVIVKDSKGQKITLPKTFIMDVTPVERAYISSGESSSLSLGELKVAKNPQRLRRRSSEEMDIEEIRHLLKLPTVHRSISASPEYLSRDAGSRYDQVIQEKAASALMDADPAIDRIAGVEIQSPHRRSAIDDVAKARFQKILDRLNKLPPALTWVPTKSEKRRCEESAAGLRARDPAIIDLHVKDSVESHNEPTKSDPTNAEYKKPILWHHASGSRVSSDSKYSSDGVTTQYRSTSPSHDSQHRFALKRSSKHLNPAAVEFSLSKPEREDIHPKKTGQNMWFNQGQGVLYQSGFPVSVPSASRLVWPAPELTPQSRGSDYNDHLSYIGLAPPQSPSQIAQPIYPDGPTATARLSVLKDQLSLADIKSYQAGTVPPLVPPAVIGVPPRSQLHDTISTAPLLHWPGGHPISPPGLQVMIPNFAGNSIGEALSSPAPPILPLPTQQPTLTAAYSSASLPSKFQTGLRDLTSESAATDPFRSVANADQPSTICGPMPFPRFPVTKKPRDHDPVKQQQYEEYLEYRKMFEPGYHQAAKIRQANRYNRQKHTAVSTRSGRGDGISA